ncbi:hypothetical protein MTO96_024956, partial [Rhipicephalus appendiculatus]
QQQQLRAFASAFGQRPPFLDPLREWDHLRRKTAEQWALDIPRRIPGAGAHHDPSQVLHLGTDPHWGPYQHYSTYLAAAGPFAAAPQALGLDGTGPPPWWRRVAVFLPFQRCLATHAWTSAYRKHSEDSDKGDRSNGSNSNSMTGGGGTVGSNGPAGGAGEQPPPSAVAAAAAAANLGLKVDPLLLGRYGNAVDLCLSDRLSELRQGLAGVNGGSAFAHQPNTTTGSLLATTAAAPYLTHAAAGYAAGLLGPHGYYASANGATWPPALAPTLLYPQLYGGSLLRNELRAASLHGGSHHHPLGGGESSSPDRSATASPTMDSDVSCSSPKHARSQDDSERSDRSISPPPLPLPMVHDRRRRGQEEALRR